MKVSQIGVMSLMVLLFAFSACAEPLRLSTLRWPPFVGQDLPDQGTTSARVRSICEVAGLDLAVSFLPWKRVLMEARTGLAQGYFPEYRSADREKEFYFSKAVGCSVVGLVHRRDVTLDWTRLEDLASYRLGVVDGYVNTEEFDRLVGAGVLNPVKCNSDELALRMLEAGRIDAAVMDRAVFRHLSGRVEPLQTPPTLVFAAKILAVHSLHVCFPRTPAGKLLAERFDRAIVSGGLELICASSTEDRH
jgi:polar amino acid transport system substrate-binding protein